MHWLNPFSPSNAWNFQPQMHHQWLTKIVVSIFGSLHFTVFHMTQWIQRIKTCHYYRIYIFRKIVQNCGVYLWKLGKKVHHISFVVAKGLQTNMFLKVMTNLHLIWPVLSKKKQSRWKQLTPNTLHTWSCWSSSETGYHLWVLKPMPALHLII